MGFGCARKIWKYDRIDMIEEKTVKVELGESKPWGVG